MSVDVLAGRRGKPDPRLRSHRLLRRLKKIEQLPVRDQKAVLRMIDMMVRARREANWRADWRAECVIPRSFDETGAARA